MKYLYFIERNRQWEMKCITERDCIVFDKGSRFFFKKVNVVRDVEYLLDDRNGVKSAVISDLAPLDFIKQYDSTVKEIKNGTTHSLNMKDNWTKKFKSGEEYIDNSKICIWDYKNLETYLHIGKDYSIEYTSTIKFTQPWIEIPDKNTK